MYTYKWNWEPNIDMYPEYIFDWSYPQFLHTKERHERRLIDFEKKKLAPLAPGQVIGHASADVVFIGWSAPEEKHRWSLGRKSQIVFIVKGTNAFKGILSLQGISFRKQRVCLSLNGKPVYDRELEQGDNLVEAEFSPALLNEGENMLEFSLPKARRPRGDPRLLALALKTLEIK
jgi:hypothetical protein